MDRRGDSSRTPMAWRHRDQQYQQQQQGYHNNGDLYGMARTGRPRPRPPRTASPPETSNSSSLSSESQVLPPAVLAASSASIAAAAAASLSTWDGELSHYGPLPGMHPMHPGMPPGMPPGMVMLPPGYAVAPLMLAPLPPPPGPPPAILLPPMMRPRPLVFPAAPTTPTPPEPLPVREPKAGMALPPKDPRHAVHGVHGVHSPANVQCCRGGCIVLWIILGLILVGALLATALRFVVH